MSRRNALTLLLVASFAILATPALAGKGGGGGGGSAGGSTIQLQMISTSRSGAATQPAFSDRVTYATSTTRTARPWANTRCYQNGVLVLDDWRGMFDGYVLSQTFSLGPTQLWIGGAASCTGRLVSLDNGTERTLATTTFDVAG